MTCGASLSMKVPEARYRAILSMSYFSGLAVAFSRVRDDVP
jgi:hypothetical protein